MLLSNLNSGSVVKMVLMVAVVALLAYLIYFFVNESDSDNNNNVVNSSNNLPVDDEDLSNQLSGVFNNVDVPDVTDVPDMPQNNNVEEGFAHCDGGHKVNEGFANVEPSEQLGGNEQPKGLGAVESTQLNQLPSECYPKDVLTSADLLPRDANSKFAQVAPSGQGSLGDKNFLTAGFHVGINTVGQSLRNANLQLRSDPPNPQVKVSPWNQTTIEPDTNRRPMEIGGN